MTREEILAGLNPEQAEAASTVAGPVLVLAGAGTGKTRVITYRIAYMLAGGIPGSSILGLTFTNKAAREMRERLALLVGEDAAKSVTLGTFHSFCGRVLRKEITRLGYLASYTIADESDQQGVFKQACGRAGCTGEDFPSSEVFAKISFWKNHLQTPDEAASVAKTFLEEQAADIYAIYQSILEEQNQIDFDDMLLLTWKIFRDFPEVLESYRNTYCYLLVDEYQDTNFAQYTILRQLGGDSPNICAVGDDDQSIYSWRGADVGNILDFPENFPGAKVIKLEQNYRSTTAILNAANAIISSGGNRRHGKQLWSSLGAGELPRCVAFGNPEEEAKNICDLIRQKMSDDPELHYRDFAVLYRSNMLSRQLEQVFRREGMPYRMFGGQPFFERQEIRDSLAYLRLAVNQADDQSLLRILSTPPRGLGGKVVELLKERRAAEHRSMLSAFSDEAFLAKLTAQARNSCRHLAEVFSDARKAFSSCGELAGKAVALLENCGYLDGLQRIYKDIDDARRRRENIDEFISALSQFEATTNNAMLSDYLDSCLLQEEKDKDSEDDSDAVIFSTVHAAKGLEFPIVFVIAMEQGIFPHERALEENGEDEERRLFYVAVTRAKQELYLFRSVRRMYRGVSRPARSSPFLHLLGSAAENKMPDEIIRKATDDEIFAMFSAVYAALHDNDEKEKK